MPVQLPPSDAGSPRAAGSPTPPASTASTSPAERGHVHLSSRIRRHRGRRRIYAGIAYADAGRGPAHEPCSSLRASADRPNYSLIMILIPDFGAGSRRQTNPCAFSLREEGGGCASQFRRASDLRRSTPMSVLYVLSSENRRSRLVPLACPALPARHYLRSPCTIVSPKSSLTDVAPRETCPKSVPPHLNATAHL